MTKSELYENIIDEETMFPNGRDYILKFGKNNFILIKNC